MSDPSNGAPTDSAQSSVEQRGVSATSPSPTSTPAKPPAEKKHLARPGSVRPREVVLGERCDRLLAQATSYPDDANVQENAAQVQADREVLGQATAKPGFDPDRLLSLKAEQKSALHALVIAVQHLCRALVLTEKGKAFVSRSRGGSTPRTARNMVRDISPEVLAHNQPLLDNVTRTLSAYDAVAPELIRERQAKQHGAEVAKAAMDRLSLSLRMLAHALGRARWRHMREFIAEPAVTPKVSAAKLKPAA